MDRDEAPLMPSPMRRAMTSLACAAVLACSSVLDPVVPADAQPVAAGMDTLIQSHYSGINDRQRVVIRDAAAWSQFWNAAMSNQVPVPPVPEVNFAANIVVAATMGRRSSGGYTIALESLKELDGQVYAVVRETSPGAGCVTTAALTAPVLAVLVPRPGAEVTFVDKTETRDCE